MNPISCITPFIECFISLCTQEASFLANVREEADELRDKLKLIEAFLCDERKKLEQNHQTEEEIKQCRDIAFDGESLVQHFDFHFPPRPRGRHTRLYRLFWNLTHLVTTVGARHRIGENLRKVKDKAESHKLTALEGELGSKDEVSLETNPVGFDGPKKELLSRLIPGSDDYDPRRSAVAVFGMHGLGKTTLANLVYHDDEVKNRFEHRVWITVPELFKTEEVLLDVVKQLRKSIKDLPDLSGGYDELGPNGVHQTLKTFLSDKRYLVVFDNLLQDDLWENIEAAFPHNSLGSRLLLTTRIENVAIRCENLSAGHVYRLQPLSEDDSWTLFCQKAFPVSRCPQGCPHAVEDISRQIVQRCQGLPLAVSLAGGMLATKDSSRFGEFKRVGDILSGVESEKNDSLRSIEKVLLLSFNDLSPKKRLCLLYLAVFPEDDIAKNILVRLWVAEGFLPEDTREKSGEDYFNDLLNRSLIQVSKRHDDGRIKACRIHDFTRKIILQEADKEYVTIIANKKERNVFPKRVRRLSVQETVENIHPKKVNFSNLSSLLFFQVEKFDSCFSISNFLKSTRLLRVLVCSNTQITIFPKEITKLYNLKYLSLSGTTVNSIPGSISKLGNLETLDLKDTGIEELPVEILQLSSLRHIHAYRYVQHGASEVFTEIKGLKALKGIDALSSLQSLCHMEASKDTLISIGKLTQLRKLGILGLETEHGHDLCAAINNLSNLITLVLQSRGEDVTLSLQNMRPIPKDLQRLYITGRLNKLPNWIQQSASLTSLVLRFSGLEKDPLENLKQMSNLVVLRLYKAYQGEELHFRARCFPKLGVLDLRSLSKLKSMIVEVRERDAVPRLETLIFEDCKELKEVPLGIERLEKLQKLELIDMDSELVRGINHRNEARVRNIKSIITRSRRGEDAAQEVHKAHMNDMRAKNIVKNHDFSKGLECWESNCCTVTFENKDGQTNVVVSNDGIGERQVLEQDITNGISYGSLYTVYASIMVSYDAKQVPIVEPIEAGFRLIYREQKIEHVPIISTSECNEKWQELKGTITISTRPVSVIFYFKLSAGVKLCIKSVNIEESEIILNPSFESNLINWSGRGCEIFESKSMGYHRYITPFSGSSFACTRNRNENWNGISQDITARVSRKLVYEVTAIVRLFCSSSVAKSYVKATLYVKTIDHREEYIGIAKVEATDAEWKILKGKFFINSEPSSVVIYVEGPPREVDILLDSLVVKHAKKEPTIIINPRFEHNLINWSGKGCQISERKLMGNNGYITPFSESSFARTRNRNEWWDGIQQDITGRVFQNLVYEVTAFVRIFSSNNATKSEVKATLYVKAINNREEYIEIAKVEATDAEWKMLQGKFFINSEPSCVVIFFEGPPPKIDILLDSLNVTQAKNILGELSEGASPPVIEIILNPRFEHNLINWSGKGCQILESKLMVNNKYVTPFSGRSFARTKNRDENTDGIKQDITGRVFRNLLYQVTAFVRIFSTSNTTKSDVKVTLHVKTIYNHEEYIEIAKVEATDAEWKMLQGKFFINSEPSSVVLYVEGPPPEVDILLDSLIVTQIKKTNVIANSDPKEKEIDPWFGLGGCILSVENGSPCELPPLARGALPTYKHGDKKLSGHYLKSAKRCEPWMGPAQMITDKLKLFLTYQVSAWVQIGFGAKSPQWVIIKLELMNQGEEAQGKVYVSAGEIEVKDENNWYEITGSFRLEKKPIYVMLYVFGPEPGIDLHVCGLHVFPVRPATGFEELELQTDKIILNPGFEHNLINWSGRGCQISESDLMENNKYITPFSGSSFACTRNRDENWNGIEQDITGRVFQNLVYEVTAFVHIFCGGKATKSDVKATLHVKTIDNREEYIVIAKVEATDAEWKMLQGKFFIKSEPSSVVLYVEGPPPEVDILLDSLVITHAKKTPSALPPVIEDPTFGENVIENSDPKENEIDAWFGLGGCILSVENGSPCELPPMARDALATYKHRDKNLSGHYLKSAKRCEPWMGPAQMITDKLKLFLTYQVSAWVQIGFGAKGPQRVIIKLELMNQGEEAQGKVYVTLGEVEAKDENNWYEIAGSFRLEKKPVYVMLYVFGPEPGIDLNVCGLHVFPVQSATRFEELRLQTDKNRKCDVVLTFPRETSDKSPITVVRVRQTQNSFPFGSCLSRSTMDNEDFMKFFLEHFNWAVFENELKWCETEKERGKVNYEDADTMLEFCKSNNIHVRGHYIFQDLKDTDWVSSLRKKQLRKVLEKRLKGFIAHCKGKVKHYEVMNEMLKGSHYGDDLGEKEIAKMWKSAKKLDPNACLFMNEDNIDDRSCYHSCPDTYIKLVEDLKSQGAPIDGIGIIGQNKSPVGVIIRSTLDELAKLKLPLWYTALKVYSANEHVRADDLEIMIREAYAHPAVGGIMLWGFWEMCTSDDHKSLSHLINADGELNEAGKRFLALKKEFMSNEEGNVDEQESFKFRGFPGTYSVEVSTALGGKVSSTFRFEKLDGPVNQPIPI